MKRLKFLISSSLFLLSPIVHAETTTVVYEPHKFTREIAKPATSSDSFEACDPKGSFRLIVENGDAKGKNRISSGVISINGTPLVTQNDFNGKASRIEKVIHNISAENSMVVELKSKPWSFVTVSVEGIMSCLEIQITDPPNGAAIGKGSTIVRGTLESQTDDVGVSVNGILAEVNGENWIALVPLTEGENSLTATATDGSGNSDEKSVNVTCESAFQPVTISANPASGIAPFKTSFAVESNISNVSKYRIDFDGDGVTDLETASAEEITHQYETPGLYLPVVTVLDSAGELYSETMVVNVLSKETMDALLQRKWTGMKNALKSGDEIAALNFYHSSSREKYGTLFNTLKERLPQIAETMGDIKIDYVRDDLAEYRISRMEEVKGETMEITYFIYFVKAADGLWKIESF